jgi:hypothetical protein
LPIGSGAFQLDRLAATRVMLRAHDQHWRARPFADALQIEMGRPLAVHLADVENGRADIVSVRPTDATSVTRRGLRVEARNRSISWPLCSSRIAPRPRSWRGGR